MAPKPFDPTVKTLVESGPDDWTVLTGQPPAPTDVIDADIATISGAADKVLRVRAASPYLLHLEFQAGHDSAQLPQALHLRNTLLEDRHDLLVRSVAVVLRPEADSPVLNGLWLRRFPGEKPYKVFRYQVLRVWQLRPAALLAGGPGTLPLAPVSAVTEAELPGIIKQMEQRLNKPRLRGRAEKLWAATYILLGLRYSEELARELLRGVESMKESVTYQAILREGRAEGLVQGKAEGKAEGALAELKKVVRLLGESRFGGPPDARTAAALERIQNLQRLEKMSVRLLAANSWQELLSGPAPRGRRHTP